MKARIDPAARRAALALLTRGEATLAEVAQLAGVSRQIVRYWAGAAGVQWARVRQARLARRWRQEIGNGSQLAQAGTAAKSASGAHPSPR